MLVLGDPRWEKKELNRGADGGGTGSSLEPVQMLDRAAQDCRRKVAERGPEAPGTDGPARARGGWHGCHHRNVANSSGATPVSTAPSSPLSNWTLTTPPERRWPGAVAPVWRDEATTLREVKRFAQGHTARLLLQQPKKESVLLNTNSSVGLAISQPRVGGAWEEGIH